MKRVVRLAVTLGGAILLIVAVSAWAAPSRGHGNHHGKHRGHGRTITVTEHADTDATTDTGASGDSAGDILTFANPVFDAADAEQVGTDQGSCIRVVKGASYECTWTTFLPGGQVVVNGPFFDAEDSTLAITGGTGRYRGARGEMQLRPLAGGTKFSFVFHLEG
jgi:allene oxide cyclase